MYSKEPFRNTATTLESSRVTYFLSVVDTNSYTAVLPDNMKLIARTHGFQFIITAIGPAHFIAECAEQLAWLHTAVYTNSRDLVGYFAPSIINYTVDTLHTGPKQSKYRGYCDIRVKFAPLTNPTDPIPQKQSLWQDLIGKRTVTQGFPISRRPEAYPGLELPFELLLSSVRTDEAIINDGLVLLKGPTLTLQLFKDTNGVFLWRPFHLENGICSCGEQHMEISFNMSYSSFDVERLETGRHIVSSCTDLLTTIAEGECSEYLYTDIFSDRMPT